MFFVFDSESGALSETFLGISYQRISEVGFGKMPASIADPERLHKALSSTPSGAAPVETTLDTSALVIDTTVPVINTSNQYSFDHFDFRHIKPNLLYFDGYFWAGAR